MSPDTNLIYPPADWTTEELATAISPNPSLSIPKYADEDVWTSVVDAPISDPVLKRLRDRAKSTQNEPLLHPPGSAMLDWIEEEVDGRLRFLRHHQRQIRRLEAYLITECIERNEKYIGLIIDIAWSLCERTSWVNPANLWRGSDDENFVDGLPRPYVDPHDRTIDLMTVTVGLTLTELVVVMREQLPAGVCNRIEIEVNNRLIEPFECRNDYWWMEPPANNWNPVCTTGAVAASLHLLSDPERLAGIIQKGAQTMRHYLEGFGRDGGTVEGINYWNYGFGHYLMCTDLIETYTNGEYSLFDIPLVQKIGRYPLAVELSPGRFVPFSDSNEQSGIAPYVASEVGRRLGEDRLIAMGRRSLKTGERDRAKRDLPRGIRDLIWTVRTPDIEDPGPTSSEYLSGIEWWTARTQSPNSDSVVGAVKGGDNGEHHNHNDCGSIVFHVNGESLVTDPGPEMYKPAYFGQDRYQFLAARSLGHSVPLVNGMEQEAESEREQRDGQTVPCAARVLDPPTGDDQIVLDLADCYPSPAGVSSLIRTVTFNRNVKNSGSHVQVVDEPSFTTEAPGTDIESVIVSFARMNEAENTVLIEGEANTVSVRPDRDADITVERLENAITKNPPSLDPDAEPRKLDLWRARISPTESTSIGYKLGVPSETESLRNTNFF